MQCQSLPWVDSHYFMADYLGGGSTLFPIFSIYNHVRLYRIILSHYNLNYLTLFLQHILSKSRILCLSFSLLPSDSVQLCVLLSQSQPIRPWRRGAGGRNQLDQTNANFTDHASPVSCSFTITDNTYMGVPAFHKFTPLHFYERPTLVPVFPNQRNPKRIFPFTNKGERENSIQPSFRGKLLQRQLASTLSSKSGPARQAPSQGTMPSISAPSPHSFELFL